MANINLSKEILENAQRAHYNAPINPENGINLVLMCSSGVDSIAATHYMMKKCHDSFFSNKIVFHVNHNLREQNDKMEESVKSFCNEMNFEFVSTKVSGREKRTEDECRDLRIDAIETMFRDSIVVTGHHLDDCVESYLLNCFRGNPSFLPMPFHTHLENSKNTIVRPFLFTSKRDFIQYADRNNLMRFVVEDETNSITEGSRRNMIRNVILPILREEAVGMPSVVKRFMDERLSKVSVNFSKKLLVS